MWLLGGEPLEQDLDRLCDLIKHLRTYGKPIVLFTRFELVEVPDKVKSGCDYIKTGKYDQTKLVPKEYGIEWYGIKLQTTNQRVWRKNISDGKEGIEWR